MAEEAAEQRTCGDCRRKILQLEKKIGKLEAIVQDKDAIIANLKARQRQTTAELVEFQLQEVMFAPRASYWRRESMKGPL